MSRGDAGICQSFTFRGETWIQFDAKEDAMISQRKPNIPLRALAVVLTALFAGGTATAQAADGTISVGLDQAALVRLQDPAADIVVGNPSIADVSVENSKLLVVTGKSYGSTNIIVIGADGSQILNRNLSVVDPSDGLVTVHKGANLERAYTTYCAPRCTAPLSIGDNKDYFDSINKQISAKQQLGQNSASSGVGQQ